jgi:hypothetical protein
MNNLPDLKNSSLKISIKELDYISKTLEKDYLGNVEELIAHNY